MKRDYTIANTVGISVVYGGRTYVTVENIHFTADEDFTRAAECPLHPSLQLHSACKTVDGSDWFDWCDPEAGWSVDPNELDAWIAARDWQANLDGVITCDADE